MSKRPHVARREEVKRLHLLFVGFPVVQGRERLQQRRARHRDASNGRKTLESECLRRESKCAACDVQPQMTNPRAVFTVGVGWIHQMTEPMLRPSVVAVVDALAQQNRLAA